MNEFELPWYTSICFYLAIFVFFLILFHVLLIKIPPLNNIQWKRIERITLFAALIGILTTVGDVRHTVLQNNIVTAASRSEPLKKSVLIFLEAGVSNAICREFTRTEFSPPEKKFATTQRSFDDQCKWFQELNHKVRSDNNHSLEDWENLLQFTKSHPTGGDTQQYELTLNSINEYTQSLKAIRMLKDMAKPWWAELLYNLGPLLLSVVVAFSITKVSSEIANLKKTGSKER